MIKKYIINFSKIILYKSKQYLFEFLDENNIKWNKIKDGIKIEYNAGVKACDPIKERIDGFCFYCGMKARRID